MIRPVLPLAIVAIAASAACTEIGTDPDAAVAIEFDSLPAPSLVAGDTLRDHLTGAAMPLSAVAYNAEGNIIAGAPIRFFAIYPDTALGVDTIASGGWFVAPDGFRGTVRLVAQVGRLPSQSRTIEVTPTPTALRAIGDTNVTLTFAASDTAATSRPLEVKVLSDDQAFPGDSIVRSRVVLYEILTTQGAAVDSTVAFVVNEQNVRSSTAVTSAAGTASRRVRVRRAAVAPGDTLVVRVTARHRGADLAGSPVRFLLVMGS